MARHGTLRQVFKGPAKTERLAFRVTLEQKHSIRTACRAVGVGMSGYLLALHDHYNSKDRRAAQ